MHGCSVDGHSDDAVRDADPPRWAFLLADGETECAANVNVELAEACAQQALCKARTVAGATWDNVKGHVLPASVLAVRPFNRAGKIRKCEFGKMGGPMLVRW